MSKPEDVIDQITNLSYTTSFDGSEDGISVLGKYHAFVKIWIANKISI